MNLTSLALRARSLVRDLTSSLFRELDVFAYINEGIERIIQVIPELHMMNTLNDHLDELYYLPKEWQHIVSIYCASKLCTQDERYYQAGTFMNEFETKLNALKIAFDNGELIIKDPEGNIVDFNKEPEYVTNRYYANRSGIVPTGKKSDMWGD